MLPRYICIQTFFSCVLFKIEYFEFSNPYKKMKNCLSTFRGSSVLKLVIKETIFESFVCLIYLSFSTYISISQTKYPVYLIIYKKPELKAHKLAYEFSFVAIDFQLNSIRT